MGFKPLKNQSQKSINRKPIKMVLQQNLWVKKQFTPLILFKAQTDGLKIDEHRTSNVQHRMMNGKNEEANV